MVCEVNEVTFRQLLNGSWSPNAVIRGSPTVSSTPNLQGGDNLPLMTPEEAESVTQSLIPSVVPLFEASIKTPRVGIGEHVKIWGEQKTWRGRGGPVPFSPHLALCAPLSAGS